MDARGLLRYGMQLGIMYVPFDTIRMNTEVFFIGLYSPLFFEINRNIGKFKDDF
jgi:hypothetical protein